MTKNILLAATALSAVALAGAAQAGTLTASIAGQNNTGATSTPYQLANEVNASAGTPLTTAADNLILNGNLTGGASAINTQYLVTFALTGAGKFHTVVLGSDLTDNATNAGCSTAVIQSGGAAGSTSVTFLVTNGDGVACSGAIPTPTTFTLTHDLRMESNADVGGTFTFATSGGVTLDNTPVSRTLVASVNGYQPFVANTVDSAAGGVDNADWATVAALTGTTPYTSFLTDGDDSNGPNDRILGAVGITQVANAVGGGAARDTYTTLTATPTVTTAPFKLAVATPVAGTTLSIGTSDTFSATAIPTTDLTASQNVFVTAVGGSTQIAGGAASVTVTPQAISGLTVDGALTGALESITLEGTNFVAPWLQMQSSYTAVVRISNIGATGTGPITLTLRANNGGTVNSTCTLTQGLLSAGTLTNGGIAANRSIEFNGKTLADACFGTTSTNADLQVTIQGTSANLTAKVRVINPGGVVSETSLGRLGESGFAF